jgi:hypothetical protein
VSHFDNWSPVTPQKEYSNIKMRRERSEQLQRAKLIKFVLYIYTKILDEILNTYSETFYMKSNLASKKEYIALIKLLLEKYDLRKEDNITYTFPLFRL